MRRCAQLCIGLDLLEQSHHAALDAFQRFGRVAFKTQHQHRRGIAGANQTKAIAPVDAQAVDGGDVHIFALHGLRSKRLQLAAEVVRLAFSAGHIEFGRGKAGGQGVEYGRRVGVAAQNFEQARAGVGAVVESRTSVP